MASDVAFSVPLEFRRGAHQENERRSVDMAIQFLRQVEEHVPIEGARILDFGCGVKVSQALRELNDPQELYFGFDVYKKMIDFMKDALKDHAKYRYETVPFQNDMYAKDGEPMTVDSKLPGVDEKSFDVALMFSVITHMVPDDAIATLSILSRYMKPTGRLVFWAFADPDQEVDFFDENPDKPLLRAKYSGSFMSDIIKQSNWKIVNERVEPRQRLRHVKTHYVCEPA